MFVCPRPRVAAGGKGGVIGGRGWFGSLLCLKRARGVHRNISVSGNVWILDDGGRERERRARRR